MAQFKEVTSIEDDTKYLINMDKVRALMGYKSSEEFGTASEDATTIYFSRRHRISVKGTPEEILRRTPLEG